MAHTRPFTRRAAAPVAARRGIAIALAATLAAACEEADVWGPQPAPAVTLAPMQFTAAVGDTVAVVVSIDEPPNRGSTARWQSSRPDVVRLDTTVTPGRPVIARAVASGTAVLTAAVTHDRVTVHASALATVVAR